MTATALIQLITEVFAEERNSLTNGAEGMEGTGGTEAAGGSAGGYSHVDGRYRTLNTLLRQKGLWPAIQVKRFFDRSGLVMLYNAYKNAENERVADLPIFKETRSVVINMDADMPEQAIVSSLSSELPVRMTDKAYLASQKQGDTYEMGYEGTMFHVYHHNYKWYFSTTTCPNINSSRYFHPTKTHGEMLDEVLLKLFPGAACSAEAEDAMEVDLEAGAEAKSLSLMVRARFTAHLDTSKSYLFVLIHHENKHLIDYTSNFGQGYKELLHISTRTRQGEESLLPMPLGYLGVLYPMMMDSVENAMLWLNHNTSYAVIIKRADGSILKVCREETVYQEETDLGNANPWHNMLWIFLKNRPDFTVAQYAKTHTFTPVRTESGKFLSPTFVIHSVISAITTYLFNLYHASTYYNLATKQLVFKAKVDKEHAPILRFHMVQLREIQKNQQPDRLISLKMVSDYLRYHQTMKNIRMLIAHFAKNPMVGVTEECQLCFVKLHEMLADRARH